MCETLFLGNTLYNGNRMMDMSKFHPKKLDSTERDKFE